MSRQGLRPKKKKPPPPPEDSSSDEVEPKVTPHPPKKRKSQDRNSSGSEPSLKSAAKKWLDEEVTAELNEMSSVSICIRISLFTKNTSPTMGPVLLQDHDKNTEFFLEGVSVMDKLDVAQAKIAALIQNHRHTCLLTRTLEHPFLHERNHRMSLPISKKVTLSDVYNHSDVLAGPRVWPSDTLNELMNKTKKVKARLTNQEGTKTFNDLNVEQLDSINLKNFVENSTAEALTPVHFVLCAVVNVAERPAGSGIF
jgi:hypothetical protein